MTEPSRGPKGYRDYQRDENYDGVSILNAKVFNANKNIVTGVGPFDVSRYAAIKVRVECTAGAGILKLSYGTREGGAAFIGKREFRLEAETGKEGILEIANLGPELTVEWEGLEAVTSATVTVVPTNRQVSQVAVPANPILITATQKLKANEATSFEPAELASGTGRLFLELPLGKPANARVYTVTSKGVVVPLAGIQTEEFKVYADTEFPLLGQALYATLLNGPVEQEITLRLTCAI